MIEHRTQFLNLIFLVLLSSPPSSRLKIFMLLIEQCELNSSLLWWCLLTAVGMHRESFMLALIDAQVNAFYLKIS